MIFAEASKQASKPEKFLAAMFGRLYSIAAIQAPHSLPGSKARASERNAAAELQRDGVFLFFQLE